MTADLTPEAEAVAYTRYEIDCPECGDVISEEADPQGEVVDCSCGSRIRVTETR